MADEITTRKLVAQEAELETAENARQALIIKDDAKKAYAIISAMLKHHKLDKYLNEHEANQASTKGNSLVIKPSFHIDHDPGLDTKENSRKRVNKIKDILDIAGIVNTIEHDNGNNGYALHVELSNANRERLKSLAQDYGVKLDSGVIR